MENNPLRVGCLTFTLTFIAGYCDTLTYFCADTIFSAHVTGNFVVFAYQLVKGADTNAWLKLITLPVFICAAMLGGWISQRFVNKYVLFYVAGIALLICGTIAHSVKLEHSGDTAWSNYLIAMIVVGAMGLQNAFGKIYSKETYGPTTMMTGNVTQFALDIRAYCNSGFASCEARKNLVKGLVILGAFLMGCSFGAITGKIFGLISLFLPGSLLVLSYCLSIGRNSILSIKDPV